MKFQWEEKDIYCGRRVVYPSTGEEWIVGHDGMGEGNLILVSLKDGMVYGGIAKRKANHIVNILNNDEMEPLTLVKPI